MEVRSTTRVALALAVLASACGPATLPAPSSPVLVTAAPSATVTPATEGLSEAEVSDSTEPSGPIPIPRLSTATTAEWNPGNGRYEQVVLVHSLRRPAAALREVTADLAKADLILTATESVPNAADLGDAHGSDDTFHVMVSLVLEPKTEFPWPPEMRADLGYVLIEVSAAEDGRLLDVVDSGFGDFDWNDYPSSRTFEAAAQYYELKRLREEDPEEFLRIVTPLGWTSEELNDVQENNKHFVWWVGTNYGFSESGEMANVLQLIEFNWSS